MRRTKVAPLLRNGKLLNKNWNRKQNRNLFQKVVVVNNFQQGQFRTSTRCVHSSFHNFERRIYGARSELNSNIAYVSFLGCWTLLMATSIMIFDTNNNTTSNVDCEGNIKGRHTSSDIPTNKAIKHRPFFLDKDVKPAQEVDFVIIGNGNAGRSAVKTLMEKCPNASIMVVDPSSINDIMEESKENLNLTFQERIMKKKQKRTQYLLGSAIGFDHTKQTVDIFLQQQSMNDVNDNGGQQKEVMKRIRFKHSFLIATGARASPPPESLIDERATERILEHRSTQLPSLNQFYLNKGISTRVNYPVLSRVAVRQISLMAASQGSKICILGSGIEAIELAAAVAEVQRNNTNNSKSTTKESKKKANAVSLVFGGAAPLANILPRYLSTAVSKRLQTQGIDIEDRTLVRYISSSQQSSNRGSVETHLVKSFDNLDSKRCQADLLVCKF